MVVMTPRRLGREVSEHKCYQALQFHCARLALKPGRCVRVCMHANVPACERASETVLTPCRDDPAPPLGRQTPPFAVFLTS